MKLYKFNRPYSNCDTHVAVGVSLKDPVVVDGKVSIPNSTTFVDIPIEFFDVSEPVKLKKVKPEPVKSKKKK